MNPERRTAVIVVIAIIVVAVLLSVLVGAWWSSCGSKWDIGAPDLRLSGSALVSAQERELARQNRMRANRRASVLEGGWGAGRDRAA